jgi:hypothetical protein
MKDNQKFRKLLDLKKIDIAILKDSEKSRIYGGVETYDGPTCYWSCVMYCTQPGQCVGTGTCDNTCVTCLVTCQTCQTCEGQPTCTGGQDTLPGTPTCDPDTTCGQYCS